MTPTFRGLLRSTSSSPHAGPHDPSAKALQTNGPIQSSMTPSAIGPGLNYGIKVLYDGSAETPANIDIVFVHGLTGNAYSTWFHKEAGVHWPSALLGRDIKDARILSFGYDADIINIWKPASNSRISNHAEHRSAVLSEFGETLIQRTERLYSFLTVLAGLLLSVLSIIQETPRNIFVRSSITQLALCSSECRIVERTLRHG